MRIGADYYPEHWEKSRWKTDVEMMQQAGIEVVRIGEFDWALYEPLEGEYHFEWLDEILNFINSSGISIVLGTPSATPPKWMVDKYGDQIYQSDIHGASKVFGTRKHYCFNSDIYREKVRTLVKMIASRYSDHPAIEGWQVDNELGWSNTTRCYCEKCHKKFQNYLESKYSDIENLNRKYGTVFWSQNYQSFDEIIIPRAGACYDSCHDTQGQNPSLLLDFYRFSSDSVISFMNETIECIREYSDKPITTNMLDASVNSGTGIDYFEMSRNLDFVSWDNYIEFQWGKAAQAAVSHDHALLRSYKHQPFWVMEQQAGACGWSKMGPTPSPGKLRLWTYQAMANGADTVVYFRWRACLFGTEELWLGILNHDGRPNRRFEEIKQVGSEIKKMNLHYKKLQPQAQIAILKSFDCEWSQTIHKHVEGFSYDKLLLDYYKAFYDNDISIDFAAPEEDLSKYALVIAPALVMADEKQINNLEEYVKNGGNLLVTFRSGIKTTDNTMIPETVPGFLKNLTGIEIVDYDPQFEKKTSVSGVFGDGAAQLWCDIIEPGEYNTLGVYTQDFYSGKPCFISHDFEKGKVYYLGCDLDENCMNQLAKYMCNKTNVTMPQYHIKGVETVRSTDGEHEVLFLMNFNEHESVIPLEHPYQDILNNQYVQDAVILKPYDVLILE